MSSPSAAQSALPPRGRGGKEKRGRGVPLFEDRGPSPPSCSFLSPEGDSREGARDPLGRSEKTRGLTLRLCFPSRKRPRFTLWSSMETRTSRKQTREVARRSTGACRPTARDSGKSTTKRSRRKSWMWLVGGLGPHAPGWAERLAPPPPVPPTRPPRRSLLQPYSLLQKRNPSPGLENPREGVSLFNRREGVIASGWDLVSAGLPHSG